MKIYKFKNYEKIFPSLYNGEVKRIIKVVPTNSPIEHMGSTAVPGLHGKGIIDLIIYSSKDRVNEIKANLEKLGYEEGSSDKDRIFLRRDSKINGKNRRFHIHIILKKQIWNDHINFRDYLIANPKISSEYAELKKKAVVACDNNGKIYRRLKDKFIKKHTEKAKNNY